MKDLDPRVEIVLEVLAISPADFYRASYSVRGFARPPRNRQAERIRDRVAAGLRCLRIGGEKMKVQAIAFALGITGHATVLGRCRRAAAKNMLTRDEIDRLANAAKPTVVSNE